MKALYDPVTCRDGFRMSIQASAHHYCRPRCDDPDGGYVELEIGFPTDVDDLLLPYAEDSSNPTETVYGYVPADIVKRVIYAHGGPLSVTPLPTLACDRTKATGEGLGGASG
jgi:hypothetical protein